MILVTGATGNVGRHVVEQLVAAGEKVRATTRRPEQAGLPDAVDVVVGDRLPRVRDRVHAVRRGGRRGDDRFERSAGGLGRGPISVPGANGCVCCKDPGISDGYGRF